MAAALISTRLHLSSVTYLPKFSTPLPVPVSFSAHGVITAHPYNIVGNISGINMCKVLEQWVFQCKHYIKIAVTLINWSSNYFCKLYKHKTLVKCLKLIILYHFEHCKKKTSKYGVTLTHIYSLCWILRFLICRKRFSF